MKKLLALSIVGSSLLLGSNSAKADWDKFGITSNYLPNTGISIFTINTAEGTSTLKGTFCVADTYLDGNMQTQDGCASEIGANSYVSPETGNYIIDVNPNNSSDNIFLEYDITNNTFKEIGTNDYDSYKTNSILNRKTVTGSLSSSGEKELKIGGEPLISKKANGELHIGKNSWITKEENGRQKVYAKDANGNPIPIDYTNGTKLLINGRDVEQSINNVGALSAALTGLPTVPTDSTLACGLGTGTHGGDFAFSGGCASKVNEKLSINYAASMTIPGQDYAGNFEDQFSARAGFVWKLGKATKPTQISMKEKKELKKEISDLKANNNQIISQNKNLQLENQSIISQNNALLARLERLEKVALGNLKSKDLAVYPLK